MTVQIYFAAGQRRWPAYAEVLPKALVEAGVDAALRCDAPDPAAVDYIVFAPDGDVSDFSPFTRTRAVLNLWAGVERVVGNPTLTQPLCRMVDPGLTQGMVEWVTGQVLRHHLGLDRFICATAPHWDQVAPPLAAERRVGILGMGALGAACARALVDLGFAVSGWSRSPRTVEGVRCLHADEGLAEVLATSEILVTLLPLTPQTEALIDAAALARMPQGAVLINPGRGGLIDDDALLAALNTGHLGHATLDVFRIEPLPHAHPFWTHPRVTVTPHVAAETRPATAARMLAENIRRDLAGLPLLHRVDRAQGY